MNPAKLFLLCNIAVLPCWLLLLVVPRWRWTQRVTTFIAPLLLAAVYACMLVTAPHVAGASFNTLEGVRLLFGSDQTLTAGWIHYLAFDLFTGSWETRDAQRLGISHWFVIPCLLLTFLFGPIGLGCYLILRAGLRRRFGVLTSDETTV